MKLRRVSIADYLNLKNVEIDFRPDFAETSDDRYGSTNLRFFVGINGSGKSNALEAIGLIFSHLAVGMVPDIGFDIEYAIRGKVVRISNLDSAGRDHRIPQLGATVWLRNDGSEGPWQDTHIQSSWNSSGSPLLPDRIVGYSTGPTSGLHWALSRSIDRQVRRRYGGVSAGPQPLDQDAQTWNEQLEEQRRAFQDERDRLMAAPSTLFLGSEDALCAVVALLSTDPPENAPAYIEGKKELIRRVGLALDTPLAAFTLRLSNDWANELTPTNSEDLKRLLKSATVNAPIEVGVGIPKGEMAPGEFHAVFDVNRTLRRQTLLDIFGTPRVFFESLLAWKRQGALKSIRLVLRKAAGKALLPESALSDGEFLFLGRYGLLLMLREVSECLVLLDEPETHFNDSWKVDLINDVVRFLDVSAEAPEARTEVIIATHSALTLTDADRSQLFLFRQRETASGNGRIEVVRPEIQPFAANRVDISRALFKIQTNVGNLARQHIEHVLESDTVSEIESELERTGPGFYSFRLRDRLATLLEGKDASSSQ